jgi:acyl-CoA synthetase (AMP-forming)/AMP-acid ligase II
MRSVVEELTQRFADRTFLVAPAAMATKITYAGLWTAGCAVAERLHDEGVRRGDPVVVLLGNSPDYVVTAFALMLLGATLVPLKPCIEADELEMICADAGARLVVVGDVAQEAVVEDVAARAWTFEPRLGREAEEAPAPLPRVEMRHDDPLVVLYTSGSTGRPKGVTLTVGPVCENFRTYGREMGFDGTTRFLQVMPIYHADGWNFSLLVPFIHGASVVLSESFGPRVCAQFERLVRSCGGNVLVAIPSILSALLAFADRYEDPAGLDYVISSSEPLHPELKREFEARFRTRVCDLYGLTETQIVTYYSPELPWKPGSVGIPQRGVDIRASDDGEIQIRSPYLFAGYMHDPDATRACYDGGWFRTRDRGHVDEEGYLFLQGRVDDAIERHGRRIYPAEIDTVLAAHPWVIESATIGAPDGTICSFVVAAGGGGGAAEAVLRAYCKEGLASGCRPERLTFLAQLPRNAIGKVDKAKLAEVVQEHVA